MADNEVRAANRARILALVHIIVGFLLFCFGIADLVVAYSWTGYISFGIWTGAWVSVSTRQIFISLLCASFSRKRANN